MLVEDTMYTTILRVRQPYISAACFFRVTSSPASMATVRAFEWIYDSVESRQSNDGGL